MAIENSSPGDYIVRYESGRDLLKKTPIFYQEITRDRLQNKFNRAYRYVEVLYDGQNPYIDAIKKNISHLVKVLKSNDWRLLRRNPPIFVSNTDTVRRMDDLVAEQLASVPAEVQFASNVISA